MDLAAGYKMTEVGIIPEAWEVKTFKDVFTFLPTNTYARDCMNDVEGEVQNVHYGDVLIKYSSILDFTKAQIPYLNPSQTKYNSRGQLQEGDIIFADTAEDEAVGKAVEVYSIGSQKAVSGLHTMLCRPKEGLFEPRFLGYFLNSSCYHNQLLPLMVGTKVSSVSKSAIIDTLILLPPKEEQKKIADAFAEYDAMLVSLESQISKKKQIKEGAMQQLLTGKKRLPGFDGEWDLIKFADLYKFAKEGGTPTTSVPEYYNPASIPFAKIEDLKKKYLHETDAYISEEGLNHSSAWIIPKNSVILSNGATLGEVSINKIEVSTKQGILGIIPKDNYESEFLYYLFKGKQFKKDLDRVTTHGTMDCAYLKDLNTIELFLPSEREEQKKIASILSDMDAEIHALELERDKYLLIKQGMMQDLLTGKTRLI